MHGHSTFTILLPVPSLLGSLCSCSGALCCGYAVVGERKIICMDFKPKILGLAAIDPHSHKMQKIDPIVSKIQPLENVKIKKEMYMVIQTLCPDD